MLYWSIFKINHRSADDDVAAGLQAQAKKQTKKMSIIIASSAPRLNGLHERRHNNKQN